MSLSCRRLIHRVLLCALVLAVMAPTLSRALAFAQGTLAPWSVVCSAPGGTPMAPEGDASHRLEQCAWCQLQLAHWAPLPVQPPLLALPLQHMLPALFLQAPRPLHAWATAQARAPPALAG
jgi:Protein of unknown function (DUF2946)